jgi:hypothetical protein
MDQDLVAGPTAPAVYLSAALAHGVATVVAGPSPFAPPGMLAAAPLAGLVFQIANLPAVSAQGPAGLAAWPRLADSLFQALARTPVSQLLLSQPAEDTFDAPNWEEEQWFPSRGSRVRRDAINHLTLPATLAPVIAERTALDQVFGQTADDFDQVADDD